MVCQLGFLCKYPVEVGSGKFSLYRLCFHSLFLCSRFHLLSMFNCFHYSRIHWAFFSFAWWSARRWFWLLAFLLFGQSTSKWLWFCTSFATFACRCVRVRSSQ